MRRRTEIYSTMTRQEAEEKEERNRSEIFSVSPSHLCRTFIIIKLLTFYRIEANKTFYIVHNDVNIKETPSEGRTDSESFPWIIVGRVCGVRDAGPESL